MLKAIITFNCLEHPLNIRFRVEQFFFHESLNIYGALFKPFTPFEYDRFEPIADKLKAGEHAGRPKTDDNMPRSNGLCHPFFRRFFNVYRKVFSVLKAVGGMNHERYVVVELLLITGIKRLAQHFDYMYSCPANVQFL